MTIVSSLCRCIQFAYQSVEVADSLTKTISNPDQTSMTSKVVLVSKITQIGCQSLGIFSNSLSTKYNCKIAEFILLSFTAPAEWIQEYYSSVDRNLSLVDRIRVIERQLAVTVRMDRLEAELNALQNRIFLEMTPQEREDNKTPIYDGSAQNQKIVGYNYIVEEVCQENLKKNVEDIDYYNVVETAYTLGAFSNMTKKIENIYSRHLYPDLAEQLNIPLDIALDEVENNDDPFNLSSLQAIPSVLHTDIVFSRYICPISLAPIRFPVGDPNNRTVYERSEIIRWINQNGTSPATREPLTAFQLVAKPALQSLIDHRLSYHSERLREYAQNQNDLNQAADANIQAAANNENPAL